MATLDWLIVLAVFMAMVAGVLLARSYSHNVVDFLAAGRTAGRYVLTLSQGVSEVGAISIVGWLEMNYVAGFPQTWWGFTMGVVILVLTVSGWVIYRFRGSRCLTLAEFFERRYSRNFRIFAGGLAFVSGLINFGIFPAVGARFFIYFCDLPRAISILGLEISTYPLVMIALLGIALFFVFSGGQVAVILADFIQGLFVNVVFVVIAVYVIWVVDWNPIFETLATAPENESLINPFKTGHVDDFNLWYFIIGVVGVIYGTMSWQGTQAYNASAKSAHEAKMAGVLTNYRWFPRNLVLLFVPIVAYTVMNHSDFTEQAVWVNAVLETADSEAIRNQLRVPLALKTLLPVGLVGAFAAVMLACFVSTHDTYLHSWGSIFVQDILIPLRGRPASQEEHLRLLRRSIVGVAIFIFFFGLLFRQSQYIFLFFAITGAIFAGGSGAVIIGGLYWKRGTTAAAWTAMIVGSTIAVGGIAVHQIVDDFFINGQMFWAIAMAASSLSYVAVSLLGRRETHDLDRLLHRGAYALATETQIVKAAPSWRARIFGMGREFTRGDKAIFVFAYCWTFTWAAIFVGGTIYNLTHEVADAFWIQFWKVYMWIQVAMALVVIVWFSIGGVRDVSSMLRQLRTMRRDADDDGVVKS